MKKVILHTCNLIIISAKEKHCSLKSRAIEEDDLNRSPSIIELKEKKEFKKIGIISIFNFNMNIELSYKTKRACSNNIRK